MWEGRWTIMHSQCVFRKRDSSGFRSCTFQTLQYNFLFYIFNMFGKELSECSFFYSILLLIQYIPRNINELIFVLVL